MTDRDFLFNEIRRDYRGLFLVQNLVLIRSTRTMDLNLPLGNSTWHLNTQTARENLPLLKKLNTFLLFFFRFGCCICLSPKLRMISGRCQHRICEDCLYDKEERRHCMDVCPMCSMVDSFPFTK